ncbi:hypothetical protein GRI97_08095 [Altererythrobacter xixiisoli]|uniref:Uncharacterized protein n=1 Tax=Croceibacterium xixiisoli TaxID=1476466 RepID=A0A6I4TVX5_9SPHN|nr:hypothetical protein [Croceibacterium xixiisoli]MXO98947.1 hypothetical protein [Croceibacterium xixiisoli]
MALKSNNTAVAVTIQPAADIFQAAGPNDLMPVSNLVLNIQGTTLDNNEYTGSVAKNAPAVVGKRVTLSYNIKLRPPGGVDVPAANAFLMGRILQAGKLTEVRNTAAIPAAPEALGVGSDVTNAVLGASAAATAQLYKGFPLILSDNGASYPRRLTAIRSYGADRKAELMEVLAIAPAANYQIPKFLGYYRSITSDDPIILSHEVFIDGHRFDLKDLRINSLRLVVPTSTKETAAYPELQVGFDAVIAATDNEATPAVPSLGAVPLFKDGDQHLSRFPIGGQTFTIDFGIQTELPPNPNKADGNDLAEIVASTASVTMTRQHYRKNVFDTLALADAQLQHPFWAQYGRAAGAMVGIVVPDARLNYGSPDLGGGLVMESGDLMVDAFDRGIGIYFPY